jgi:hypothetical protein
MANMIKLLLVVFAVHFTLLITGLATIPGMSLYNFLVNPTDWDASLFLASISDLFLTVIGATAIIAGTVVTRSDIFIFGAMASILLSLGLPLAELWILINGQLNWQMASLLVGPLILIYVFTCVTWWRGRA